MSNLAYDCYRLYVALKAHFTTKTYDFIQHNGATNVKPFSFNRRKDQYQFHKLSQHKDPKGFLIANAVAGRLKWVGDMTIDKDSESVYNDWVRRRDSLTHIFRTEIKKLDPDFNKNFCVVNGQHPYLLKLYRQKQVSIETMVILNSILNFIPVWDKKIEENIVWPDISLLLKKYTPFVKFNFENVKNILRNHVETSQDGINRLPLKA